MAMFARRLGGATSDDAKRRFRAIKGFPTLDAWRNPVTRGLARRLANEAWRKTLGELDFQYRLSEETLGSQPCVLYETTAARAGAPTVLFLHGGWFVAGSPAACAAGVLPACRLSGCDGVGVEYGLLPEAAFPQPIEALDAVYRATLEAAPRRRIILAAEATGAAIALAAMMRWRKHGTASPAGAVFFSPCVDGAARSDSHASLDGRDPEFRSMNGAFLRGLFRYYAPGRALDDPEVSPIYGTFDYLPPMLIIAGAREALLGDAARLAETARAAGVRVDLRIYDGMWHRFHAQWSLPEARAAHQAAADFIAGL